MKNVHQYLCVLCLIFLIWSKERFSYGVSTHTGWIDTYFEKCLLITCKITYSVPYYLIFRYYGTVGMCCTIMMEVPKCLWKNVRQCICVLCVSFLIWSKEWFSYEVSTTHSVDWYTLLKVPFNYLQDYYITCSVPNDLIFKHYGSGKTICLWRNFNTNS